MLVSQVAGHQHNYSLRADTAWVSSMFLIEDLRGFWIGLLSNELKISSNRIYSGFNPTTARVLQLHMAITSRVLI